MSTRSQANWHLAEIESKQDEVDVEAMGLEIDLRQSPDELQQKLEGMVRREARLYNKGLSCDLKMNGQSCHTCPVRCEDPDDLRSTVCRIGLQQEDVITAIERVGDHMEALATAAGVPEFVEFAEACA